MGLFSKIGKGLKNTRRRKLKRRLRKARCVAACKNPNPSSVPCSAQCTPPSKGFVVSMKPQTGDEHECDVFVFKAEALRHNLKSAKKTRARKVAAAKMKFQCQRTT